MSATTLSAADLRPVDLFDDLDDAALAEFAAVATPFEARAGEVVAEPGAAIGVILLLDGVLRTLIPDGDRAEPTGQHHAPTWLGAIGALTRGSLGVRVQAHTDCRMARIVPDDFRPLAFAHTAVHDRVMRQVGPVMSRITAIEHNRERLASLGTMAAGLAHELNNPAAAATRTAAQMAETLETVSATIGHFVHSGVEREEAAKLVALHDEVVAAAGTRTALDALGAADAEDELIARLEELGVREPWALAEPLAAAGVDGAWLDRVHALAGPPTHAARPRGAATPPAPGPPAAPQG